MHRHGYAPAIAESVLDRLRSLNYLNDASFARGWALTRVRDRAFGPRRIEQELIHKGVSRPLIQAALREAFDQVDEAEPARRLLMRHFKESDLTDPKTLRRAAAFLRRRGYGSNVVFNLLRYPIEDD